MYSYSFQRDESFFSKHVCSVKAADDKVQMNSYHDLNYFRAY